MYHRSISKLRSIRFLPSLKMTIKQSFSSVLFTMFNRPGETGFACRGFVSAYSGEKLLARCELLRDQVNLAFEEINQSKEAPSGEFALTLPHACERDIVIPALNQLCKEFPGIEPRIVVTDESMDLIQNNLDVAIFGGELKDSNYRALPIGTASEIFCATPAYIHKQGSLNKPDDLPLHDLIATAWQSSPLSLYKNDKPAESIPIEVKYHIKANTMPSVLEIVLSGMGIALLPEFAVRSHIANGDLIRALPGYQGWQWPFYLVHRFHGEKPVHVTRFYQLVKHFFAKANA